MEQVPDDRQAIAPDDTVLLIVEDDPHYARIMLDLAHDHGLKVLIAARGAEALALARQYQPTAVSLDVFLPDMLGWTVLSQLKQDPTTRHIPVQIVTLDEDRQHGLARGAFSFITKPTTTEGLQDALSRITDYARPRRKRLLVVEDNPAERLGITELLGHDDIDIVNVDTGADAIAEMKRGVDCVVLDLRLPDMSGFDVLDRIRADAELSDIPVVVFTGRELSPEEDAQLHTMARSVVVKGVESPERLLDETALFLHRVVADLPGEKQRMLERLHSSDENLVGQTVLLVDDDARNIFALSSVLERRGMEVLTATTGREAISLLERDAWRGDRADGYHDAGNGWLSDHAGDPRQFGVPAAADHRADRQGDEGRPREVPGGRGVRLPGQAGQHRAASFGAAHLAASVRRGMTALDQVNILLVDDQPAKLLSYEVILSELGENLIKASSAREALEQLLRKEIAVVLTDVSMPELDGFELAAMIREHPRYQQTAIIFVSAIHLTDLDRLRGYEAGAVDYLPVPVVPELLRAKVKVFAELYRKTRQLEQLNAELERRVAERTAELAETNAELELRVEERTREREAAVAQIHEMQKMESLGQLTGGVAHDFNNLLMAVLGNLALLKKRVPDNPALSAADRRRDPRCRAWRNAHQAHAGLRPAPGTQAGDGGPAAAGRWHGGTAAPLARPRHRDRDRLRSRPADDPDRSQPVRAGAAQSRAERARRDARRRPRPDHRPAGTRRSRGGRAGYR